MSIKYIIIIILLLVIIYLYHKNQIIENLTEIDSDKILEQLSSVYNNGTLTVENLKVTNSLEAPNVHIDTEKPIEINNDINLLENKKLSLDNIIINKSFNAPNIVSDKDKQIEINNDVNINNNKSLISTNLKTNNINSITDNININSGVIMKSNVTINKDLTAPSLITRAIYSTGGENNWVDFKSNVNNRGKTTKIEGTLNYQGSNIQKRNDIMAGKMTRLAY